MDRHARFCGTLIGAAVGDAVGELAFRCPERERLHAEIERSGGLRYTDDTAMAQALAESLAAVGDLDPQHLGEGLQRRYEREPWRGYGAGPPQIFLRVAATGESYETAARRLFGGAGSLGNGAAMRVAPLALFFHDSPELDAKARLSALVTHAHPVGVDAAAIQALAVAGALHLETGAAFDGAHFAESLAQHARTQELFRKLTALAGLLRSGAAPEAAAAALGTGVRGDESVPFALYCFLRHAHDYRAAVECAALQGGDRDTLGTLAGAVSGAFLGLEAIPARWRARLEEAGRIESLARAMLRAPRRAIDFA